MNKEKEKPISWGEWWKKWRCWIFHTASISLMVAIFVLGIWDAYNCKYLIGADKPITLKDLLTFLGGAFVLYVTVCFSWQRLKSNKEQTKIQADKGIDDRYNAAVNSLGSSETSARTGAIYSLYQQAMDYEKYRQQIVQILCSHIRSKTQEPEYQQQYKDSPSHEIQTTIDLLLKKTKSTAGLYPQFGPALPITDLSHAYCVGANFRGADCQIADFGGAHCQGANFRETDCQGANFEGAHCQKADFGEAYCQRANFWRTDCKGAIFWGAHCQEAYFWRTDCKGADFKKAHCQGANFWETDCQEAIFFGAHCQGANFWGAHCQGVNFMEAECQETLFWGTNCKGAYGSTQFRSLEDSIGKDTELDEVMVLEGTLSKKSIDAIAKAKPRCSSEWDSKMLKTIKKNEGKEEKRGAPEGIISGVLEDSDELQKVIKELRNIRERDSWLLFRR